MLDDMLEREIEDLWREIERADWLRNDAGRSWERPFWIWGAAALAIFGWQVPVAYATEGFGVGTVFLFLVLCVWMVPALMLKNRFERRDKRRVQRGLSPNSADDLRALREKQRASVTYPYFSYYKEWLSQGSKRRFEAEAKERATANRRNFEEIFSRAAEQRDERLRRLIDPEKDPGKQE